MTIEKTSHPPPEIMAAIAEGKLKRREIEPLLGHLEECAECRSEMDLAGHSFRQEESQTRFGPRFLWFSAAAAAAIAVMVVLTMVRPWSSRGSRSPIAALVALAPRSARVVEPRLSGGFTYAPFSGPMRAGDPAAEADRLKLDGQAGIAIEQASRSSSPEAQHAAGVAYLLIDKPGQAIERLRASTVQKPDDAGVWSDLAAAQYAEALRVPAPSLLPQALASADHALRIDPDNAEALFNRALILERLGLIKQARSAWERYLTVDPSSAWAVEARSRLRALPSAEGDALFRRELPRIEKAAAANDATIVAGAVRRWREQSRAWGEAEFLGRWGEAMQRGDAVEAARLLAVARSLGSTLREQSGERLLADSVAAIDRADAATRATLAEAHVIYRRGRIAYSRRQPSAAEPDLRRAATLFAGGRSPMERMALYYAANTRYDQNDVATARTQLEALLAHEESGYIASGALIRWQLSLCRNADGDAEGALALLAASASSLQRLDERNNLGFVESLLAVTLLVEGRPDEAWEARIRSFEALSTEGRGDRLLANLAGAVADERRAGHTDAALALLGVEREAGRDVQDDVLLSGTLTRAAMLTAELGDIRGAARLLDEVRGVSARVTDPAFRSLVDANVNVAQAAATLHSDPALAVKNMTAAAGAFEQMGQHALAIDCYLLRARGERALGDLPAAARTVDEGLARFERFQVQLAGGAVDEGVLESGSELIEEAIRLSLDRGETALAFGYAENARMHFAGASASPAHDVAAAVQSRLSGSGAALVEVVILPAETIIFSLDGTRLSAARQPLSREAMISMVQRAAAGDRQTSASLYELLLRPGALVPRARTLVVVPDPLLDSLPFAALYDSAAKRYLIEEVAVVLAESGTSLRAPAAARPLARVLAMSLPSGGNTGSAELTETNAEVSDVVSSYSHGAALRDSQSTFAALAEGGRDADVIHLSGHTDEIGSGGTAALMFAAADGVRRERIPWKMIAAASFPRLQVAVLAACDTLRLPPRRAGARAPSLGGAFLAAGARAAVGTLRPIGDRDARLLFRALNQQLGRGVSVAEAVRNVQREAIAGGASSAAWSAIAVLTREIPRDVGKD